MHIYIRIIAWIFLAWVIYRIMEVLIPYAAIALLIYGAVYLLLKRR